MEPAPHASSGAAGGPELVRAMGRWTLAALVVNAILGSGIFALPATIARLLGPLAPWAWVAGALGNGVVMLCFAEVASRFSAAGGAYLYARSTLPRLLAILVGWLAFLTRVTAASAGANLFSVNLVALAPATGGEAGRIALLTLLVAGLTLVNLRGVEQGARWNNAFTIAKLLPLAVLLAAGGFFLLTRGAFPAPPAATAGAADWLRASLLICFAYGGYDGAMMAMGEARNPRRDAPFALLVAMVFLALLYTAVQVVVDLTLANPGASERPLADAAAVVLGPWGSTFLAAGTVVSIVGFLGANFLNAPRLAYALAEHRDLPPIFGRIHPKFRTPDVAIVAFGLVTLALAVYGNFEWNATLSAIARLIVYASTCVAMLLLRRRDPAGAALRLPAGPIVAILGLAFCALLISQMGRVEVAMLAGVSALVTLHWAIVRRRA
jgi:amino acid transporter